MHQSGDSHRVDSQLAVDSQIVSDSELDGDSQRDGGGRLDGVARLALAEAEPDTDANITDSDARTDSDAGTGPPAWRNLALSSAERVADLLSRLTLEEKVGQLASFWPGATATPGDMAPHQHELSDGAPSWDEIIRTGLGQLTRPFGTAPVDAAVGALALARIQCQIVAANRFGIPAVAHEECLTGLMTLGATVYPTPLAWGATFDPELVERMAAQTGADMRRLGIHLGLSPVLDVTRDPRWGRTEETIGEDPYLVATVGTAYVRGLQSAGVIATLKHFAGYSASRGGRNFGPVAIGRRELADVLLPPFEMAVRDGGAGAVMHSYVELDGIPVASDGTLLTYVLREEWGFTGTVVADYFGVLFLERLHHVAADAAEAAGLALAAGVDVELPATHCYGSPLVAAVRSGAIPEALVDRAAERVLRQKCELGLLDPDWSPVPEALAGSGAAEPDGRELESRDPENVRGTVDLDPPAARALARQLADESIVLLANDGTLPLARQARVAVVGPLADNTTGLFGCYSFPSHVGVQHPELPLGIDATTPLSAIRSALPEASVTYAAGCTVDDADTSGIEAAVRTAAEADVCVAVLGDRAALFGNGTSGEGCDAADLHLPGVQARLLESLLDTGTPVVLVLMTGRPYALGPIGDRPGAVVQAFFPGEEGGPALADVLSGRVCPSGRLPVSVPRHSGSQPTTYLTPALGRRSGVSNVDPTALYPFGHGLSYTTFTWDDVCVDDVPVGDATPGSTVEIPTDGAVTVSLTVRNTGDRAGADVVQLYLHDPVAEVTRPVVKLIGYARVQLDPGEARRVAFRVHADLASFTGRAGQRIVEPGDLKLHLSASSDDHRHTVAARLVGERRIVDHHRRLTTDVTVQ